MNLAAIFTGIVTIAKAVPQVAAIINKFYDVWLDYQIEKIDKYRINKREKRAVILKSIRDAKSNDERKALSIVLADIDRL
jgi:hypothetical protein